MADKGKILLIGGGGHCKSVLDSIMSLNEYSEIGIIDITFDASALGVPVIGNDSDLKDLFLSGWKAAFITVGSVGSTKKRHDICEMLKAIGFDIPIVIDPSACVSKKAIIGEGTFIGKNAVVNADCKVGSFAIINSGSVVEHDCCVGDYSHISPGAVLCGQVSVGSDTHIGAGSVVKQGLTVGDNSMIGIGSVVVNSIPDNVKAFGNPCKVISE